MKKNVLVITGSPRRNGNTDILAEAFINGAKKAGHKVSRFNAGRKKIKGCMACNKCYSRGTPCVFKDDFNDLAPLIEEADFVAFATPLYFYNFTSQIKAAIDKMYALYVGKRKMSGKGCALLACGETDDIKEFEGIIKTYEIFTKFLEWKNRGEIIVPNVNNKGDIKSNIALDEALKLGANL